MRTNRLLDLTNLVALSPAKHFFNGLLDRRGGGDDARPDALAGTGTVDRPGARCAPVAQEVVDDSRACPSVATTTPSRTRSWRKPRALLSLANRCLQPLGHLSGRFDHPIRPPARQFPPAPCSRDLPDSGSRVSLRRAGLGLGTGSGSPMGQPRPPGATASPRPVPAIHGASKPLFLGPMGLSAGSPACTFF